MAVGWQLLDLICLSHCLCSLCQGHGWDELQELGVDFQKSQVNPGHWQTNTCRLAAVSEWFGCGNVFSRSLLVILDGQVEQELTPRTGLDPHCKIETSFSGNESKPDNEALRAWVVLIWIDWRKAMLGTLYTEPRTARYVVLWTQMEKQKQLG